MRAVFIGCVDFSHAMLSHLLTFPGIEVVGVVTRRQSAFNADFRSLEDLAVPAGIPCFFAEGNNQEDMSRVIDGWSADVVFCLGWSYLLRAEILSLPRFGVIGYHPALLPRNRGRHPIVWALALGLAETGSTFFIMDEGADSGDIISQERVAITPSDDAASLYARLEQASRRQLGDIVSQLAARRLERRPQDHAAATYWRKRGRADGRIDWRMSMAAIANLVRGLTRPYVGAHCEIAGADVKIWRVSLLPDAPTDLEPGRVLATRDGLPVVKCADGAVRLDEHEFATLPNVGDCL